MAFMMGGGSQQNRTTSTTPLSGLLPQLTSTLISGLKGIGGGGGTQQGVQALTNVSQQQTGYGIGAIKQAFAASGMAGSSDIARSIGRFVSDQSTNLAGQVAQFTQTGIQDQLAAISEIISMASGAGMTESHGSNFGWQLAIKMLKGQ